VATELGYPHDVRFTPDSDRIADISGGPVRAKNGSHEDISVTVILVLAQTLRVQSLTSFVAGLVESSHQQDKPAVTLRLKAIQNPKHIYSTPILHELCGKSRHKPVLAHTGAFRRRQTDCNVGGVTRSCISIY